MKEKEKGHRRREIEVMRLILCFLCFQRTAVSFGYRTRAFFLVSPASMQSLAPPSRCSRVSSSSLSSLSFSRGIMRPSCRELLRLYLFFFSTVSRPYVKRCRTLDDFSTPGWKLSIAFFLMLNIHMKVFYRAYIPNTYVIFEVK